MSQAHFLAVAEHWLVPARARKVTTQLRKAGRSSVCAPSCQDVTPGVMQEWELSVFMVLSFRSPLFFAWNMQCAIRNVPTTVVGLVGGQSGLLIFSVLPL